MMKCDQCEKTASVHVTRVVEGKVEKIHLCEACAQKLGVSQGGPTVTEALLGGGGTVAPSKTARECPGCGLTLRGFQKRGRLGCAECYETFGAEVERLLRSMHYAVEHQGRAPRRRFPHQSLLHEMDVLQGRLNRAIEAEEYEDAAKIRDELHSLQAELASGGVVS